MDIPLEIMLDLSIFAPLGLLLRIIFVSGFLKNVEVHTLTGRWGNPWPTDVGP